MELFKIKARVSNIKDPSLYFEDEFWVDTGALYSFIPEEYLERIGVEAATKRNLVLADGRKDTRRLGFCDFQINGFDGRITCPVIFAPEGSLFLLGATALENFGVDADPVQKKLKPILAVIGGFIASHNAARLLNETHPRFDVAQRQISEKHSEHFAPSLTDTPPPASQTTARRFLPCA